MLVSFSKIGSISDNSKMLNILANPELIEFSDGIATILHNDN